MTDEDQPVLTPHDLRHVLLTALERIKIDADFAAGSNEPEPLPLPSLSVNGVGQIPLPLLAHHCQLLWDALEQAPSGEGLGTFDLSVRNFVQIDASFVTLSPKWNAAINQVAQKHSKQLGLRTNYKDVQATLSKLVLFVNRGFHLPQKDTEKEYGKFGSLVVQLPACFAGGELQIKVGEETATFNWSGDSSSDSFFAASFFSDCEHEVKEVTGGYKLCLMYNLTVPDGTSLPDETSPESRAAYVEAKGNLIDAHESWVELMNRGIADSSATTKNEDVMDTEICSTNEAKQENILVGQKRKREDTFGKSSEISQGSEDKKRKCDSQSTDKVPRFMAVPLEHIYTQANLSFELLKGQDARKASILRSTGKYSMFLGLLKRHVSGPGSFIKIRSRSSLDDDWDDEDRDPNSYTMVEECIEKVDFKWICGENDLSIDLKDLEVGSNDIIHKYDVRTDFRNLFREEPEEKEVEGYSRHRSIDLEYYYHRALLVFTPQERVVQDMIAPCGIDTLITFLVDNCDTQSFKDVLSKISISGENSPTPQSIMKLLKIANVHGSEEECMQLLFLFSAMKYLPKEKERNYSLRAKDERSLDKYADEKLWVSCIRDFIIKFCNHQGIMTILKAIIRHCAVERIDVCIPLCQGLKLQRERQSGSNDSAGTSGDISHLSETVLQFDYLLLESFINSPVSVESPTPSTMKRVASLRYLSEAVFSLSRRDNATSETTTKAFDLKNRFISRVAKTSINGLSHLLDVCHDLNYSSEVSDILEAISMHGLSHPTFRDSCANFFDFRLNENGILAERKSSWTSTNGTDHWYTQDSYVALLSSLQKHASKLRGDSLSSHILKGIKEIPNTAFWLHLCYSLNNSVGKALLPVILPTVLKWKSVHEDNVKILVECLFRHATDQKSELESFFEWMKSGAFSVQFTSDYSIFFKSIYHVVLRSAVDNKSVEGVLRTLEIMKSVWPTEATKSEERTTFFSRSYLRSDSDKTLILDIIRSFEWEKIRAALLEALRCSPQLKELMSKIRNGADIVSVLLKSKNGDMKQPIIDILCMVLQLCGTFETTHDLKRGLERVTSIMAEVLEVYEGQEKTLIDTICHAPSVNQMALSLILANDRMLSKLSKASVVTLVELRMPKLMQVEPSETDKNYWCRPNAVFSRDPVVTKFLQGPKKSQRFHTIGKLPFKDFEHAWGFSRDYMMRSKYGIKCDANEKNGKCSVTITKNDILMEQYRVEQNEKLVLQKLLG